MRLALALLVFVALPTGAFAQGLTISLANTTQSVIAAQKGKRITMRLRSGQELSGLVRDASDRVLVLGEVSGREFFDAAVPLEAIEAVLVRTRQQ